jgi:hypothetical protein
VRIERAERVGAAEEERVETTAPTAERSPASARAIEEGRRKVAARLREVTKRANALSDRAERAAISLDPVERQE